MKVTLFTAAFAAAALTASMASVASAAASGNWSISARDGDAAQVQLRIEYSDFSHGSSWISNTSSSVPIAEAGIPPERLRGPIGPVTFRIVREPGSFDCSGSAGQGSAAGQFTYAPSASFDDALAKRGLERPTAQQSLRLAMSGTTVALVDQFRATSRHVTTADVVNAVEHGVSARYVADLAALGYRTASLDELVAMRDHGVSTDFVRAVQSAGYRNLSSADLVRLADHGVRERYIGEMRAAGFTSVTADQLVDLRDHGVSPQYLADLAAAGYKGLSTADAISLRDHGVSAAFVARLHAHGYANLSVHDLIRLRDSGF